MSAQQGPQDDRGREGISTLEIGDLPPVQRSIMRVMLRSRSLTYAGLCSALADLPEASRPGREQIDDALRSLVEQSWLTRHEGTGETSASPEYRVNFRVRAARTLTQVQPRRRSGSSLGKSIWDALEPDSKKDGPGPEQGSGSSSQ